ncbi:MAG: MBL fold metallo-hydrolase [Sphaerochaetaceae bacterium]|nr:MBL fold metallo-hydrolase [Sphaerochaetaceae bacterium]
MKITTLVDNHAMEGSVCGSEHGFSVYIETEKHRILFDTGCGSLFLENARRLSVDLSAIDTLIISHGHYDHAGGVRTLLETFSFDSLPMFTGEGFFNRKFVKEPQGERELGVSFDSEYLRSRGVDHQTVGKDPVLIGDGIYLLSRFTGKDENEDLNPRFLLETDEGVEVDRFNDEVSLVFDTPEGLILIVGCSHPGILRIVERVKSTFGKPIKALLGGIHLYDASEEKMKRVSDALIGMHIETLGVSHCTGDAAGEYLKARTDRFFINAAGKQTEL